MSNRLRVLRRRGVFAPLLCSGVAARGGAVAFSPLDLTPALWIDPSDTATMFQAITGTTAVTDGSVCGTQNDKSGASFNLAAAANDGTRPTWNNNAGLPYLGYDGVDDITFKASDLGLYSAGACSIFIACRAATPGVGKALACQGNTGNDVPIYVILRSDATTQTSNAPFIRTDANTVDLNQLPVTASFYGADRVIGCTDSGTVYTPYINGVAQTTQSYARSGATTLNNFALGGLLKTSAQAWAAGRVYGLVIVKRVVTGAEIANITTYLGAKMGLSL